MTISRLAAIFFMAGEYLIYFLDRTDHYSLHTPFAFSLYRDLRINLDQHRKGNPTLEILRLRLGKDKSVLKIKDEGAGSKFALGSNRSVSSICKNSCSSLSYNLLYQFFLTETPALTVVELGTSLGINTGYLADRTIGTVYTFEADPSLLEIAGKNLCSFSNVHFIPGNIQDTLPVFLKGRSRIDFIQIDANHTHAATLQYCKWVWPYLHEKSVVVVGDIHWSPEMKNVWLEIKRFPGVSSTMDFFECGVLFFRSGIQVEHHILYYPGY